MSSLDLHINGEARTVQASPGRRLSEVLRHEAGCLDVKVGCDAGDCGACTVLIDDSPTCACLTPAAQAVGRRVTTLKGIGWDRLHDSFLRHGAAQCGICTPAMIVAAHALLRSNPKPKTEEIEDAIGGILCRCTGYSKIVAAIADYSANSGESDARSIARLDGRRKIDGSDRFGADFAPDGALLVRAIRSPHAAAGFEFGDLSAWRDDNPGIEAVLTASDIEGINLFGVIPPMADQPALAESRIRMKGEPVAIVVGEAAIVEALDLSNFPVRWIPDQAVMEADEALKSAALHDNRPDNVLVRGRVATGDPDRALENAAYRVTRQFVTSFVEHAPIEPEAGCAWMEGDTVVIAACTQSPMMDRDDIAAILGLPQDRVRILPTAVGGGFGTKLDLSLQPLIALAAWKTGKPCRMTYTRGESMATTTKRHPAEMTVCIGCDEGGKIVGMTFHGEFNTGPYASWGPTVANRVPVHASGPYRTPDYRATTRAIHTNAAIGGAFRGFGVPQAALILETSLDILAERCSLDRLDFRILNALRDGEATVCGQRPRSVGILECLQVLKPHYHRAIDEAADANRTQSSLRRGVGVASCWYGCGNTALPNPSTIRLGITKNGRLRLHQGAVDIGQGSNTVITQICSRSLGIAVDQFELVSGDTHKTPDCGKTSASRQTFITGNAARLAGESLRREILRMTNISDKASIELADGRLAVSDGEQERHIDLTSLVENEWGYVLSAEETYDPPTLALDENGQGEPYAVYGYGAHLVELEVDGELGTVKVLRVTAAHDVGHAINPTLVTGQIEGGIAQGLGLALMEEFIPHRTENLHDYLIPTVGDMPEIVPILIEKPDPEGPYGAKGLGEHVLIPTAPAILNAIRHATGAEIDKVPALPHRVAEAIQKASS